MLILQGISGAGKSTFARSFPGAVICSADHYFMVGDRYVFDKGRTKEAHDACMRAFIKAVTAGYHEVEIPRVAVPLSRFDGPKAVETVILDNTNTQRWEMAAYVQIARAYGYEVEIHTFLVDPKIAFKRSRHNVPWDTVLRSALFMDAPLSTWGRHVVHLPDSTMWSAHLDDPKPA